MTAVERLVENGNRIIRFLKDFTTAPANNVSISYLNADGSETDYTFPNIAKFTGDVSAAVHDELTKTIYVDAVNGNDGNDGTSTATAVKNISAAIEKVPSGGTVILVLESDVAINTSIYTSNKNVKIMLNGHVLTSSFYETDADARMHRISGSVSVNGGYLSGSKIVLPEYTGDKPVSAIYGSMFGNKYACGNGDAKVAVSYGVEVVDNGAGFLMSIGASVASLSVGCGTVFNFNNSERASIEQLITGIIRDADSGNPVNLLSNINLSA